ncbi:hypothetical protein NQ317_011524 [Molorchus minor]|uniref:Ubiquitin-like protease family profile domain-containing protein n=1 Tax=Molorchus minor TaxID=1323400 RepID=A0ABQ9K5J0_9CUCU|nr:hypothetical protein NQ317_011524 [Molorchus minor]
MAQYYEVLSQRNDKAADPQFYNNIEDQTVQYVITPEKTQVQYPTQQIVVTSGDQLMVVDSQPQHIVIDQSPGTYQAQQIQQQIQVQVQQPVQIQQQQIQVQQPVQVQTQQYAVIQQDAISNGTQQIFYMEGSNNERVIVEQQGVQQTQSQPIVLNHQLSQNTSIVRNTPNKVNTAQLPQQVRLGIRQPQLQTRPQNRLMARPPPPNQQLRHQSPLLRLPIPNQVPQLRVTNPSQLRQPNPQSTQSQNRQQVTNQITQSVNSSQQFRPQNPNQAPVRQPNPNQVRIANPGQQSQVRPTGQRPTPQQIQKSQINARFPGLAQLQQKQQQKVNAINNHQQNEIEDTEIKPNDEQEAVSLPDGSVVSVAVYKKMLAEAKAKTALQQRTSSSPQVANPNQTTAGVPSTNSSPKKRNATPRANPRQPSKANAGISPNTNPSWNVPAGRGRVPQFVPPSARPQQPTNDPSRFAMMNQQQAANKAPPQQIPQQQQSPQFQNQLQNQMMQPQQQQQRPNQRQSQANYVIQPPKPNQKPTQQRPLPAFIPSRQITVKNTLVGEDFSDSIRMLVLLENGEQRLITFTLPKEACTIQEILEQVNVPFQNDTNIQVTEANTNGINYIVTVGNVPNFGYEDEEPQMQEEQPPPPQPPQVPPLTPSTSPTQPQVPSQTQPQQLPPCPALQGPQLPTEPPKPPSPELQKEIPKYVPGMLALCAGCGYLSEDFSKCIRCNRKLPDNVKAIPATIRAANGPKKELGSMQHSQPQAKSPTGITKPASPVKKKSTRSTKPIEHESVVISSDDEEEEEKPCKVSENILQKLGASITISPVTKEPSANDIQRHSSVKTKIEGGEEEQAASIVIECRTIRIGSYRCIPTEKVIVDSNKIMMKVPHPGKENCVKTITVARCEVVKVLASFNKALPVFFYYLNPAVAKIIREELDMMPDGDYYYDPLSSKEEAFRRITLLPEDINDDDREIFQKIYGCTPGVLDELNVKEANDILIKTCPKELTKAALGLGRFTEIKQLLTYPPEGRGRISINTEDYVCLAQDQFLNDVIIDFYLKYLVENLSPEQKPRVHIFSTFFYKRLTTKPTKASRKSQPSELDPTLTAAQKRHARVKTWTKNVNLFEKDFVVVPINENAHWFLAIICYPGMDGCQTWDGKPYKLEVQSRRKKKAVTDMEKKGSVKQEKIEKPIICEEPELSDKDEAEGDDSDLESDDSEELPLSQSTVTSTTAPSPPQPTPSPPQIPTRQPKESRPPIKQPCVLIFDSLAGASRCRVVATLRDYLTCEYKAKLGKERIFNKDVIKGACPKVPQQNNFTDCGLYLLQYVEHFFSDPIKDYHIPISQIKNWFDEFIVTKKREDIANLIKSLMEEYGKDIRLLPDIAFPTLNGKLVEHDDEEDEMMEEEEFGMDEEHHELREDSSTPGPEQSGNDSFTDTSVTGDSKEEDTSPMKPSSENISGDFVTHPVLNPKPDISEFPRQTNRDTLSYLKAKRIIRHKNSDGPDIKKLKSDDVQ